MTIDNRGGVAGMMGSDLVAKIDAEANQALAASGVREKLAAHGIEPADGTAAQFAPFIQIETARSAKVAQTVGAQPE